MDTFKIAKNLERLSVENAFLKKMLIFMTDQMIDFDLIFWNDGFHANCSDLFWWGCADSVEITDKTFIVLEQSIKKDIPDDPALGIWLYCCRQRKMRPQGAAYDYIKKEYWELFHKCGPERKTGFGNPKGNPI